MIVEVDGMYQLDVPEDTIDRYIEEFSTLPGGKHYESIVMLRELIEEVIETVALEPDLLEELEYEKDFIKAIAMREALIHHGIFYDA